MNLKNKWRYIKSASEKRLGNNKTAMHIDTYGDELEILGAAGEIAARRFLGLPEKLHYRHDNGVDLYWRGHTVDVKATHMTPRLHHRFLQWPHYKPIKADIILMTAVNLSTKRATVVGFATRTEMEVSPINTDRKIPCHEIKLTMLHPAWKMFVLSHKEA